MKLINRYKNGNYSVFLFDNGTKIRVLPDSEDTFKPSFPENIDLKITNKCTVGCPYCHENSSKTGKCADLEKLMVSNFILSLNPGTELAIGGGGLSTVNRDDFRAFLKILEIKDVVANITVNAQEIARSRGFKTYLKSLIYRNEVYGVGISYCDEYFNEIEELVGNFPNNIVVHTIAGITTPEQYKKLAKLGCKVLVLGYKNFRRGEKYFEKFQTAINENLNWLSENITDLRDSFKALSFDNLATEQLHLKDKLDKETWEKYYMGDDGTITMYVDAVDMKYAKSSTQPVKERFDFNYNMEVTDIFKNIREE